MKNLVLGFLLIIGYSAQALALEPTWICYGSSKKVEEPNPSSDAARFRIEIYNHPRTYSTEAKFYLGYDSERALAIFEMEERSDFMDYHAPGRWIQRHGLASFRSQDHSKGVLSVVWHSDERAQVRGKRGMVASISAVIKGRERQVYGRSELVRINGGRAVCLENK